MLNNAIEKNKRYLRFCSYVAQFSGLLLLLLGFISLVLTLWNFYPTDRLPKHDVAAFVYKFISPFILRLIFPGLFLLGINQLIKCLIDINFKPNWILKFSDCEELFQLLKNQKRWSKGSRQMINIRLDYVLLDKRMKLKDLAEATGLAVNNLSILKTNKARAIRFSTLNSLCKALNCTPGDLLEYVPETQEN